VLKKGFAEFLGGEQPDVLCLQEIKCTEADCASLWTTQYSASWNSAQKKGYSGTALFSKEAPASVRFGVDGKADDEGRVITAEFKRFHLVNVYCPNSKGDLSRLPYRQQWDQELLTYLKMLEQTKPVVVCGDLNVAHTTIDIAHPKRNERTAGFTIEERRGFDALVQAGFIDTFRVFEPGGGHYTWWSNFANARSRNLGWRIDYFLISPALRPQLKSASILPHVMGSDHCPVAIELDV
jgi:exodeoxyribonuclease-3